MRVDFCYYYSLIFTSKNYTNDSFKYIWLERTVKPIYGLADYLEEKPVYVNGENELARKNARSGHILYDRGRVGNWKIENPKTDLTGTSFILTKNSTRLELKSALLGLHQIGPLAASAEIALNLGLSFDQVRERKWVHGRSDMV